MEATTATSSGLLEKIRPPRLEDAGLEDCALPPDSIKEAFLRATAAVGSRTAWIFDKEEEERCVDDPWDEKTGDDLVGAIEGVDPPPGACVAEKGGGVGALVGDEVAAGLTEAEERGDRVVDGVDPAEEGGGEACVDGLKGLEIGDKEKGKKSGGQEEEEEGGRPSLGETFVL